MNSGWTRDERCRLYIFSRFDFGSGRFCGSRVAWSESSCPMNGRGLLVRPGSDLGDHAERRAPRGARAADCRPASGHLELKPEYVAVEVNRDLLVGARHADNAAGAGGRAGNRHAGRRGSGGPRRPECRAPEDRHPHGPEPAVRRHGQVRDARTDARLPGGQRRRGGDRRRPPRAADRPPGAQPARLTSTRGGTPSCPIRPAASRPRTPCAPPGWAASCSRAWTTPGPTG